MTARLTIRDDDPALGLLPPSEQRAGLLAALRRGDPLPPGVGAMLATLLQQVAQAAHRARTGHYKPTDYLLGVLDVIADEDQKLMDEWGEQHG